MAQVIGVTGLIGAGKSVVVQTMASLIGVPTFDSDRYAKETYRDQHVRKVIISNFGFDPINSDDSLDKSNLRRILENPRQKDQLEKIIHKAVEDVFYDFVNQCKAMYIVLESAILFTSGFNQLCDYTIAVVANNEMRKNRVLKRDVERSEDDFDHLASLQSAEGKLQNQMATFKINNDGNHSIIKAVEAIWGEITNI